MGVRSTSKPKRRRRASPPPGCADLISGLGDDMLVRILELLPDAADAVRTGALSRRWRGLWTRVGSLIFDSSTSRGDKWFLDFVQSTLAQRAEADAAALEHLASSFAIMSLDDDPATKPLVLRSTDAAQEWIRYAVQKEAKSFVLELELSPVWNRKCPETIRCSIWKKEEQPVINLDDLPGSTKLETMHWKMNGVRLQLPAAAVFASLMDLSLEKIKLAAGSGHLLARLLSSACCPSLQKLQLRKLVLPDLNELLIEANALLELFMSTSPGAGLTLKLKTPSLRILHLENYAHLEIFAPKLEDLTVLPSPPDHIEVDGELPCVGSLKVVELESHGNKDNINDSGIFLLRRCTSLTCLEVSLHVSATEEEEYWLADIISGRIPHLQHLISLTVDVDSLDLHSFGVGLSEILKQCNSLKYLSVNCFVETPGLHALQQTPSLPTSYDDDFLCDHEDRYKSHQVYLANMQEVQFTGLVGTDCESAFIQGLLSHAIQLQKVSLSFDPGFRLYNIDYSWYFMNGGGTWVCHDRSLSYEWNSNLVRN